MGEATVGRVEWHARSHWALTVNMVLPPGMGAGEIPLPSREVCGRASVVCLT